MANTINWGKATQNNTNGFGKYENTINAGDIYEDSWAGETALVASSETKYLHFEIDTSLYDATNLDYKFGFDYFGSANASGTGQLGSWTTGTIDVEWGDGTTETLGYLDADSRSGYTRFNFLHTYSTGGVYEIKIDFTNTFNTTTDAIHFAIAGWSAIGGNGTPDTANRARVTKFITFGNTVRFGSFKRLPYTSYAGIFGSLVNCTQLPSDTAQLHTDYVDSNWHLQMLKNNQNITTWKSSLFGMDASPAQFKFTNRTYNTFEDCHRIENIEFKNVNILSGFTNALDPPSDNVGQNVTNGTKAVFDSITFDEISGGSYAGYCLQQFAFSSSSNRLHKDSMFRNIVIGSMNDSVVTFGFNVSMMSDAILIVDDDENLKIDHTNIRMADNSVLHVEKSAFSVLPKPFDISTNAYRATDWEIDLTSTSQWRLTGSYQNKLNLTDKIPADGVLKISGTGNWDITGVTDWFIFSWYGATSNSKLDMDMSGWEVWNTATMNYFFNLVGLTTERYDQALISWNDNVPNSASAVNIRLGSSQYTSGGDAEEARTNLIETHGWTISDGGSA